MEGSTEFWSQFAANTTDRLDKLEDFANRADAFLFKDELGKPSLATIAYTVHNHVAVLCSIAGAARRTLGALARILKYFAIIATSVVAIAAALQYFGGRAAAAEAIASAINEHGTFKEYLLSVLHSKALIQFAVVMAFGTAGMIGNWVCRYLFDQISNLWQYLFVDYPRRTAAAFLVFTGYAFGVVQGLDDSTTWGVVVNLGFSTGFAIDAMLNKAKRREWTDEERASAGKTQP